MQLDSEDLIAQFKKDWPAEAEVSTLRLLVQVQAREIERLTASQAPLLPRAGDTSVFTASVPRPYVQDQDEGARHGG